MDERVRAQTKKCLCFTNGPGRVTSLLMVHAAWVVLHVWTVSVLIPIRSWGLVVQDMIVFIARPSRGEKCW
jgi:hypothetical protein